MRGRISLNVIKVVLDFADRGPTSCNPHRRNRFRLCNRGPVQTIFHSNFVIDVSSCYSFIEPVWILQTGQCMVELVATVENLTIRISNGPTALRIWYISCTPEVHICCVAFGMKDLASLYIKD